MIVLAVDTTATTATAAVSDGGEVLGLYTLNALKTQSELLLPMIDALLGSLRLKITDVGLFAVSVGPGSFTGVRIGVSLIKGLAYGDVPCAAVSTLEALAENLGGIPGIVVPVMDARRSQLYTAIFRDGKRLLPDSLLSADALTEALTVYDEPVYFVGDGVRVAKALVNHANIPLAAHLLRQNAAAVAAVANRMYAENRGILTPSALAPLYLRASQAERERAEREAGNALS